MLNTDVAVADAVRHSSNIDPWRAIGAETNVDPKLCLEKVLLRRKTVNYTRERWSGPDTVSSSVGGEAAPRTTVRISDVVEVGGRCSIYRQTSKIWSVAVDVSRVQEKVKRGEFQ